ncbi:MAG: TlpA family protein disulfide reductase [Planctomycetaceae bacterium]|jgi:thiol-disulfide isomerase/thioredoxin|nr:TlpA family protein disulfide reductase [Planctomycetaceae bacterium]
MTLLRIIFFVVLFSVVCLAADDEWQPDKIPDDNLHGFIVYYQNFLHTNPFPIAPNPQNIKEIETNINNHKKAAALYNKLSQIADNLAKSDTLPDSSDVKKNYKNHIRNTWNLYANIPANAADLWAESCFLKYKSLTHEVDLEPDKIKVLHIFTTEIEQYNELKSLFQDLKRDACLRSLKFVQKPLDKHKKNNVQKLPDIDVHGKNLETAIEFLVDFLRRYPTESNLKIAEPFIETINLFREFDADLKYYGRIVERLEVLFAAIQKHEYNPVVNEYAKIYEGMLRRQRIIGKPMPIWGADVNGKILDENLLKGKVVLLDFWATWCAPCVEEFPHLKKIYAKYKDRGFEIVCYSVDADTDRLRDYLKRNDLSWIVLSKETTEKANLPSLSAYYGARKLPVVLLRDKNGNAILTEANSEKLDAVLKEIFDKK